MVCRGYYLRASCIDQVLKQFLAKDLGCRKQVPFLTQHEEWYMSAEISFPCVSASWPAVSLWVFLKMITTMKTRIMTIIVIRLIIVTLKCPILNFLKSFHWVANFLQHACMHTVSGRRLVHITCNAWSAYHIQQHASVSQGQICSDKFMCCHTEIEVVDQTYYLTQSQYIDTGPTSPSADPITPGTWQGSHWNANS